MGIFDKFTRSETVPMDSENINTGNVLNIEFNGFSKSNRDIALKLSALYSGTNLISETIASLPIYKYKIEKDGSKVRVNEKINYLLNRSCNGFITSFDLKDTIIKSAILEGNGFALIVRNDNFEIEKLIPLKKSEVELRQINGTDEYMYKITKENYQGEYQYFEVINLALNSEDGVNGKGILELGKEVIGLGNAQSKFIGATLTNGSYMKGLLTTPNNLSPEQRENLSQKIKSFFSGGNSGRVLVLPDDLKYQNISLSPADVELLKMQEFNISEIARLLKISPHMIGGAEKSGNYGNLEQSNLQFLQYTLLPYIRRIEEICNMQLLTEEEKESGNYFYEFNISNLLRTNRKDEIEYYTRALDAGVYSINEVRNKLNENRVEGLDVHTLSKFNSIVRDGQVINTIMNQTINEKTNEYEEKNTSEEN
ncbi:Phage portal protein [Romboutsia ilealis]|uniref:Phage portal protein n=1 Tax=Romboutsia ilealis TaxID=1115758 RepID=A0A1V1I1I2_9FIRM|nr:phage portal protein [Romboutsia ilealis]CED93254.1 Phage portal protein [Romboutsia ilealis]